MKPKCNFLVKYLLRICFCFVIVCIDLFISILFIDLHIYVYVLGKGGVVKFSSCTAQIYHHYYCINQSSFTETKSTKVGG